MLRIHLFLMRIWILDPHRELDPDSGHEHWTLNILEDLLTFFIKAEFSNYFLLFLHVLMLKLDEPFRYQEIFIISLFYLTVLIRVLRVNFFFAVYICHFVPWIQICESAYFCGSGSRKPNLADPFDPDLKHCSFKEYFMRIYLGNRWWDRSCESQDDAFIRSSGQNILFKERCKQIEGFMHRRRRQANSCLVNFMRHFSH